MRAIETKPTWQPLLLTSILPQLRHYRRLKIIATFAVAGSLESVLEAATAAICRHVKRIWRANQTNTPEMTSFDKTLFGKLQRIFNPICVFEKFFDICNIIKKI